MKKLKKQIALAALAVVLAIAGLAGFTYQNNSTMLQNKKALANVPKLNCVRHGVYCKVKAQDADGNPMTLKIWGYKNVQEN